MPKIQDKKLPPTIGPRGGKRHTLVDVCDKNCPSRPCYQPMPNKGSFINGRGYTSHNENPEWVCRTRHLWGCPEGIV